MLVAAPPVFSGGAEPVPEAPAPVDSAPEAAGVETATVELANEGTAVPAGTELFPAGAETAGAEGAGTTGTPVVASTGADGATDGRTG